MIESLRPRVGLVGAGGISHAHLPHLLRLSSEVLVFAEEGAPALVARYGGRVVGSLDELIDQVDVVDVATPASTHASIAIRALESGKDVISEKPLERTVESAEAMLAAAARTGRRLYVGHVVRYFPEYVALREAVLDGRLGELAVCRFTRSGAFPIRTAWFADVRRSGGVVLDQMIHDLDVARWIAGEVRTVSAVAAARGTAHEPVLAAHVLLTHDSGAISHAAGVWGPQHLRFTTSYSVAGTGGTLEHDSRAEQPVSTDLAAQTSGGEALPEVDAGADPYFLELAEFLASAAGGPEPRVSALDGLAAVRIATAALESIETGRPVSLLQAAA